MICPVLAYHAQQHIDKNLVVPGDAFNKEDYGIALPS
jgi:hypothetical protein